MKLFITLTIFVALSQAQDLSGVKFTFYGSSLSDYKNIDLTNAGYGLKPLSATYYDPKKKNFIFIPGFQPNSFTESINLVIDAYLKNRKSDYNIINLDWLAYSSKLDYYGTVKKINPVISTANKILLQLKSQEFSVENTKITGFSLGVLIASGIGRYFRDYQNILLPRITALEPPEMFMTLTMTLKEFGVQKLNRNDAKFVDVVHTNVGQFGDGKTHGHVNFWVNGGSYQLGCSILNATFVLEALASWNGISAAVTCSHNRAYILYAESVARTLESPGFTSRRCPLTTKIYEPAFCLSLSSTSMGFYADVTYTNIQNIETDNFYVGTMNSSPYSLS